MAERLTDSLVAGVAEGGIPTFHELRNLAREVQSLRKLCDDLLALHRSDGTQNPWCDHDGFSYPCPTVRMIEEARK